jgi:hypothetical protein
MYKRLMHKVVLNLLAFQAAASSCSADSIGSTLMPRPVTDLAAGVIFIYAGDYFLPNTQVDYYSFWDSTDPGRNPGRYITPILLQQVAAGPNPTDDAFQVVALGAGQTVMYPGPYTFGFNLQAGSDMIPDTANLGYTFGFINALLDANGNVTSTSTGVVDLDIGMVDPGTGYSGRGTNEWRFVYPNLPTAIPVGTVLGGSAPYPLNDRTSSTSLYDRTYSMIMNSQ